MKRILLACGSGVATSTAVMHKVQELLDANGYSGKYQLSQCAIAEAVLKSPDFDLLIATTAKPDGLECAYLPGISFLTGMGKDQVEQQILDFMEA